MSDDIEKLFRAPGALKQFTEWAAEDIFSAMRDFANKKVATDNNQKKESQIPPPADESFMNFLFNKDNISQRTPQKRFDGTGRTNCVCPSCGFKKEHAPGRRCVEEKCPKCGHRMMGE